MTLLESVRLDDFNVADTNTAHVVVVPAQANKFSAQLTSDASTDFGDLVVKVRWSVVPDAVNVPRLWSDFGTLVKLCTTTDWGAHNVDVAADFLVFQVTTAGGGTTAPARLFCNFYSRPGGP